MLGTERPRPSSKEATVYNHQSRSCHVGWHDEERQHGELRGTEGKAVTLPG